MLKQIQYNVRRPHSGPLPSVSHSLAYGLSDVTPVYVLGEGEQQGVSLFPVWAYQFH